MQVLGGAQGKVPSGRDGGVGCVAPFGPPVRASLDPHLEQAQSLICYSGTWTSRFLSLTPSQPANLPWWDPGAEGNCRQSPALAGSSQNTGMRLMGWGGCQGRLHVGAPCTSRTHAGSARSSEHSELAMPACDGSLPFHPFLLPPRPSHDELQLGLLCLVREAP